MNSRTSITHPLQIAEVSVPPAKGSIGITFCPGKKQVSAMSGAWDRDLGLDLDTIKAWGASTIVTLIEPHEIQELKVTGIDSEAGVLNGSTCRSLTSRRPTIASQKPGANTARDWSMRFELAPGWLSTARVALAAPAPWRP